MRLEPRFQIPDDPKEAIKALSERLRVLEDLVQKNTVAQTKVVNAEPSKPRDGMFAYADGTNWDPGYGRGLYQYQTDHWQPVSTATAIPPVTPIDTAEAIGNAQQRLFKTSVLAANERWAIGLSGTEAGANAGSELSFWSYGDDGNYIRRVLGIERATAILKDLTGLQFYSTGASLDSALLKLKDTNAQLQLLNGNDGFRWRLDGSGGLALHKTTDNFSATTAPVAVDANGVITLATQPRTCLYRSAAFTITSGAWNAITLDATLSTVGGLTIDGGNPTRVTIPVTGLYLCTYGVGFDYNAGGGYRQSSIRLNGSTYYGISSIAKVNVVGCGTIATASQLMPLTAGNYLELCGFHDAGTTINGVPGVIGTWLHIVKVA